MGTRASCCGKAAQRKHCSKLPRSIANSAKESRAAAANRTWVRLKIISSVASACLPSAFFFAYCFQTGVLLPPEPLRRAAAAVPLKGVLLLGAAACRCA